MRLKVLEAFLFITVSPFLKRRAVYLGLYILSYSLKSFYRAANEWAFDEFAGNWRAKTQNKIYFKECL